MLRGRVDGCRREVERTLTLDHHLVGEDGRQIDAELGGGAGEAEQVPLRAETDGRVESQAVLTVDGVAQQTDSRLSVQRLVDHGANPAHRALRHRVDVLRATEREQPAGRTRARWRSHAF